MYLCGLTADYGILWFYNAGILTLFKEHGGWKTAGSNSMVDVMEDVLKICNKISKKMDITYVLKSKVIDHEKVFSTSGLLPSIIKRADQLSLLLFGRKTGADFKDNEKAMLGVEVKIDACKRITSLLCVADVLMELIKKAKNNRVDVDELLYD